MLARRSWVLTRTAQLQRRLAAYNRCMSQVISLAKRRRQSRREAAAGKTLCRIGRHKWEIDQSAPFTVHKGRLVTIYLCSRCGAKKTELS